MTPEAGFKNRVRRKFGDQPMLTDTQCRTAKPKDKPYKLTDGKGLHLEVKTNGSKAWRYRFELRTGDTIKESTFAIGDYAIAPRGESPAEAQARKNGRRFTLAEARDERVKARDLVKQGINPAQHRQLERIKREQESATTFEAVAKEWLALKDWAEITRPGGWICSSAWSFPRLVHGRSRASPQRISWMCLPRRRRKTA
jgi:hypothetical protein